MYDKTKLYSKIQILFENNHLLVVLKPAGVLSQSDGSGAPDLLSIMKEYLVDTKEKKGDAYLGLVHRLDRNVAGVMVFAKTSKAAARISEQIKNHTFIKEYICVVHSAPKKNKATLECHMRELIDDNKFIKTEICPSGYQGAKEAKLHYELLKSNGNFSLLRVRLVSGRKHQIRVQLANEGCPIYGDYKYDPVLNKDFIGKKKPIALWAAMISFKDPVEDYIRTFIIEPNDEVPWKWFDIKTYLRPTRIKTDYEGE